MTAPLPAGAQFLNVIESVFSGMSRAVIHNSVPGSICARVSGRPKYQHDWAGQDSGDGEPRTSQTDVRYLLPLAAGGNRKRLHRLALPSVHRGRMGLQTGRASEGYCATSTRAHERTDRDGKVVTCEAGQRRAM